MDMLRHAFERAQRNAAQAQRSEMDQKARDIAEGIALQLMTIVDEFAQNNRGIPIGHGDLQIVDIDFDGDEESHDDTVGIQLSDGTTWEIRPYQVVEWKKKK